METMSIGENSRYAMQMNRYFLMPIGVWPLSTDANYIQRLFQKLAVITSYMLICFILVPCALHTFLEEPDRAIKLKLIGPMNFHIVAISKYFSLIGIIPKIGECFEHVENDWKFYQEKNATVELSIMRSKAKLGRFLPLFFGAFMYGGGFFYHVIMPFSAGKIVTTGFLQKLSQINLENSTELNVYARVPRPMIHPVYEHLMNIENSPWYEIVYTLQCMAGYVVYTITIGTSSLAAGFVVHVCGQLEIVMNLLDEFVHGNEPGASDKLKTIVDKHIRALSFAMTVEKNLNVIFFIEFFGSTINICLLGYFLITEWESRNTISTITYCILLISFIFSTFIFCFTGEILTEQCKKVGEITYCIDWYKLPGKKATDIIMIIILSSCYPARITAGKMVFLSLSSFGNMIKTAATYMNLLRTVML